MLRSNPTARIFLDGSSYAAEGWPQLCKPDEFRARQVFEGKFCQGWTRRLKWNLPLAWQHVLDVLQSMQTGIPHSRVSRWLSGGCLQVISTVGCATSDGPGSEAGLTPRPVRL